MVKVKIHGKEVIGNEIITIIDGIVKVDNNQHSIIYGKTIIEVIDGIELKFDDNIVVIHDDDTKPIFCNGIEIKFSEVKSPLDNTPN